MRIAHIYQEVDKLKNRPRSESPRVSNERKVCYWVQYARKQWTATASASVLRSHFQGTFHSIIATPTVRRQLHHANLRAKRPLRVSTHFPDISSRCESTGASFYSKEGGCDLQTEPELNW